MVIPILNLVISSSSVKTMVFRNLGTV